MNPSDDRYYDEHVDSLVPQMKAICALCGATIREAQQGHETDAVIYGICEKCVTELKPGLQRIVRPAR